LLDDEGSSNSSSSGTLSSGEMDDSTSASVVGSTASVSSDASRSTMPPYGLDDSPSIYASAGANRSPTAAAPVTSPLTVTRQYKPLPREPSNGPRVLLVAPGLKDTVFPFLALARELVVVGFSVALSAHVSSWVDAKAEILELAPFIRFFALEGEPKEFVASAKFRDVRSHAHNSRKLQQPFM